ncbi:MAG: hypothetical protein EU550_01655 [Promethearchaeota archaeon]|nr:MAG: hypothetical protein EU550_01655 [Candidatus Lokiarchaeota archaeon]
MVEVNVICPICNKSGRITVDEDSIKKNRRGVTAINVTESLICSHSFVSYIDKNLNVRDSFVCDFKIELPEIKQEEVDLPDQSEDVAEIKPDLILLNIKANEIVDILNGVFMKKKILLLNENEILYNPIINMMKFVFQHNFDYDFSILNRQEYIKNKKKYKDFEIIDKERNLSKRKKELKSKTIKVEGAIVKKFLLEASSYSGLLLFRNEILKAFQMSKSIIEILKNYQKEEKISKKKLVDLLSEKYEISIQFEYLEFLLDIVKNYHGYNLSRVSDYYFPNLGL